MDHCGQLCASSTTLQPWAPHHTTRAQGMEIHAQSSCRHAVHMTSLSACTHTHTHTLTHTHINIHTHLQNRTHRACRITASNSPWPQCLLRAAQHRSLPTAILHELRQYRARRARQAQPFFAARARLPIQLMQAQSTLLNKKFGKRIVESFKVSTSEEIVFNFEMLRARA